MSSPDLENRFEHTGTISTSAPATAVWSLWSDPATWSAWDPAVEDARLEGPFEQGTVGTIVLTGGLEAPVTLEVVEPGTRYLDQLTIGDLVIRIDHVVRATTPDGAEITVSTLITGPGADDIGPMVTADAPRALAALVAMAEG